MPLDQTELDQISADAKEGKINPLIANLSTLGLTLRTLADETNYKKRVEDDVLSTREPIIHGLYEKQIEEETGIKKNPGEKGTDYLKRATTGIKTELQELKDKKDDGTASTADKARITELQDLLSKKDDEVKNKDTEYADKLRNYRVDGEVRGALAAIKSKLVPTLTGEAKDDVVEARLAKFRKEYTAVEEGTGDDAVIVYKKSDGSFANDTKGKRLTTEQLLEQVFGSYVDTGKKQEGAGTGGKKAPDGGGNTATVDTYAPGAEVKTKNDLMADLKANGFLKGTADFSTLFKKHGEGLRIS